MKTKPVGIYEGTLTGRLLKSRFGVILSNWMFQGMRFMNIYEIFIKLTLDLLMMVLILSYVDLTLANTLITIIFAHTLNWIINGHFFVLMRYVRPFPKEKQDFDSFVQKLKVKSIGLKCIESVAIYGSYCRNTLNENSDLDVRIIVGEGVMAGLCGALFCFYARVYAIIQAFPLDIFCCVKGRGLEKMREDEIPVILFDKTGFITEYYK